MAFPVSWGIVFVDHRAIGKAGTGVSLNAKWSLFPPLAKVRDHDSGLRISFCSCLLGLQQQGGEGKVTGLSLLGETSLEEGTFFDKV